MESPTMISSFRNSRLRSSLLTGAIVSLAAAAFMTEAPAASFTVSELTRGAPGSALGIEGPGAPNDVYQSHFNGSNNKDVDNAALGLPQSPNVLDSLSAGADPLDADLWDLVFSVSPGSRGVAPSSVNFFADDVTLAAKIFFANPAIQGSNRLLSNAENLGIVGAGADIDGMEVFDSRLGGEVSYAGFTATNDGVFFSLQGSGDIYLDPNAGSGLLSVFREARSIGLGAGDGIDALALDVAITGDGKVEALFSLAPGSPSLLALGGSAADIYYTDFDGSFEIAGPGNIDFAFALNYANLGLLFSDDVDGIDIAFTSTRLGIPQDPNWPLDRPVVAPIPLPIPALMLFSAFTGLIILRRAARVAA